MSRPPLRSVLHRLLQAAAPRGASGLTDGQLLERFLNWRDQAAFEVLLWRYGPAVWTVCRRVLRHPHDAEDAFQATFLALVRKAGSIRRPGALGGWLRRVAYRIALAARTAERTVPPVGQVASAADNPAHLVEALDLRPVLAEEVGSLPEKYRLPFVLCCVEGRTTDETAQLLGWPRGTVATRLRGARQRLRRCLARRGVVSTAIGATLAAPAAASFVPARMVAATVEAVLSGAASGAGASARAAALAEGAIRAMTVTRLQFVTGLALALGVLAAGAGVAAHRLLAADAALQAAPPPLSSPSTGQPAQPAADAATGSQTVRQSLVRRGGGNERSEAAVKAGLEWLLEHQAPDGRWSLDDFCQGGKCNCDGKGTKNDIAGTAFGLLPLLGAGLTSQSDGEQKRQGQAVGRGLKFLVSKMNRDGDFGGGMYAHGLATMALAHAYGLTRDPQLMAPAQRAVDYIVKAQHTGGGWRYAPGQPGDTSVTSWQVQALKTAQLAGLRVPKEAFDGAGRWLDSVRADDGGYGYTAPRSTPTMTAAGLLSRQYLGRGGEGPRLLPGLRLLAQIQPGARNNLYHDYHATLVMAQAGGEEWPSWNTKMRDRLLELQDKGADAKRAHQRGSWWPAGDPHGPQGGRVMTTSLALLCLEVYYRNDLLLASRPPRDLSARGAEALWTDLSGDDLLRARQAVWDLAHVPRRAVPLCQEQLKPAAPPEGGDRERLARLIGELDSDNFTTREQATRALEKLGERAEPALRRALEDRPTLEVRQRIEQILQKRKAERAAALVRTQRAVEVLEHTGTPEARELLKTLSQGDPDALLTREAKATLARLRER